MDPMTMNAPFASEQQPIDTRRVSPDPIEGYVLDPWSGLYQETEATYQHRLQAALAEPA